MGISSPNAKTHRLVGVAGVSPATRPTGILPVAGWSRLSGWRASAPATGTTGILPVAVGRDHRARRYGSTTTLKNRIAAFSAAVAPSTAFHSPSSTITLTGNAAILAAAGCAPRARRSVGRALRASRTPTVPSPPCPATIRKECPQMLSASNPSHAYRRHTADCAPYRRFPPARQ